MIATWFSMTESLRMTRRLGLRWSTAEWNANLLRRWRKVIVVEDDIVSWSVELTAVNRRLSATGIATSKRRRNNYTSPNNKNNIMATIKMWKQPKKYNNIDANATVKWTLKRRVKLLLPKPIWDNWNRSRRSTTTITKSITTTRKINRKFQLPWKLTTTMRTWCWAMDRVQETGKLFHCHHHKVKAEALAEHEVKSAFIILFLKIFENGLMK